VAQAAQQLAALPQHYARFYGARAVAQLARALALPAGELDVWRLHAAAGPGGEGQGEGEAAADEAGARAGARPAA
jgi:hypothetical protein